MRNRALLAIICASIIVLVWQMALLGSHSLLLGDFRAFYCGGAVAVHGQNPYLAAPLLQCESTAQPFGLHRAPAGLAEPVPFPGYAFALFVPFALLPIVPACLAWLSLLIGGAAGGCAFLARIANRPFTSAFTVFALGMSIAVWTYGELAPVILFALAAAALALKRSRFVLCAALLCAAQILPHVAGPAFVALFIWERRTRLPLIVGGAALVLMDLCVGGPRVALAYFTIILPAHAQSEIGYITQYGLTWIVHAAGGSDRAAIVSGELSYAVLACCGIWVAGLLARATGERAFIVLAPPAFAVVAGPFMHYSEIMLALPAAFLLYTHSKGRARVTSAAALLLIAVPWQWLIQITLTIPAFLAVFAMCRYSLRVSALASLRITIAAAAVATAIVLAAAAAGPQVAAAGAASHIDPALAQASWAAYLRSHSASAGITWWIAKAPTWLGLVLLALSCAQVLVKENLVAPVAIKQMPVTS